MRFQVRERNKKYGQNTVKIRSTYGQNTLLAVLDPASILGFKVYLHITRSPQKFEKISQLFLTLLGNF